MNIYPAIDIREGKCVRLTQGDFNQTKVYDEDPVQVARKWKEAGAEYLHIVDLDGALQGTGVNEEVIRKIVNEIDMKVQVGGGIRTLEMIEKKLSLGVHRVILGTAAIKNPQLVEQAVNLYGDRIIVGIDAKDGYVAVEGWGEVSSVSAVELAKNMEKLGVCTIVYTDIAKDGMLSGPNFQATKELIENTNLQIIASGGVHVKEDVLKLKDDNAYGVIIGKALYEKTIDLREVMEIC